MSESYIQKLFADRIGGKKFGKETVLYKFEKIKRAKAAAAKRFPNVELLDFGVGEPDEKADDMVVRSLAIEAEKEENRGYADNGIDEFKSAAAAYLKNIFGVEGIDPATQVCHSIGSKPGLAMLPLAFINPGDVTIMTTPGYPVLGTHTRWLGGEVYNLPLTRERGFLPDLGAIPADILKRAKVLLINYPNNPTGAVATPEFYAEVVSFAREHEIIVVQDAAYAALSYTDRPLSFLAAPGAIDIGVEVHSLSKAFNMTGWRMAFVAGNELVVKGYATVKDNYDSGQFKAIQKACCTALAHPEITERTKKKYQRRLEELARVLNAVGFSAEPSKGTFYLYVATPKGTKDGRSFATAEEFSEFLIAEKLISTVPWDDAGHFVRFAVSFVAKTDKAEATVFTELAKRLGELEFVF